MLILPRRVRPTAGASAGRRQDRCRACPDGPAAQPRDPQPARLGGLCLRHHRDCAAPRVGSDPAISARRVPLLHPAPEGCDHGEQHSRDGSQQEGDSRRQVHVNSLRPTHRRRPDTPPASTNSKQQHRPPIRLAGALLRPRGALPAAPAGAPGSPGCPRGRPNHSPSPHPAASRAAPSPGWRRLAARWTAGTRHAAVALWCIATGGPGPRPAVIAAPRRRARRSCYRPAVRSAHQVPPSLGGLPH
jgi:hypothetical protein